MISLPSEEAGCMTCLYSIAQFSIYTQPDKRNRKKNLLYWVGIPKTNVWNEKSMFLSFYHKRKVH